MMPSGRDRICWTVCAALMATLSSAAISAPCAPELVGTNVAHATQVLPAFSGRAWGQVFAAPESLVRRITVWRAAEPDSNYDPMHLFLTKVDANGRPVLEDLILDGPSRIIPFGGAGQPVQVDFTFDPPFVLPGTGSFFFAVKEDECTYVIAFLGDTLNPYSEGSAWRTEPWDLACEGVGCCPFGFQGNVDLAFEVEFCRTDSVPARRRSWGAVKSTYR